MTGAVGFVLCRGEPLKVFRNQVIDVLTQGLGASEAARVVHSTADALGFGPELEVVQALRLLDRLAGVPGLVGITAHFSKSHALLAWQTGGAAPRRERALNEQRASSSPRARAGRR
jgi:hypothetical protein